MEKRITVLGMPMNGGQPKPGTHLGPEALRNAGLIERLRELNPMLIDLGDVNLKEFSPETEGSGLKNLDYVVSSCTDLVGAINKVDVKKEFLLVLGGDHSMTIGTLAGIANRYDNLGVIWFDAHGDLNTSETSPTGNIHGMSLAVSLGIGEESLVNIGDYQPKIRFENVVLIGARDLDEGEKVLIENLGIKVYTMEDVLRLGMDVVVSESIERLSGCDGVHLSLDVDGFCPMLTPGTGTRVPDGVTYDDGLVFLESLCEANIITSMEIVEINPLLESEENKTALETVELVMALFDRKSKD